MKFYGSLRTGKRNFGCSLRYHALAPNTQLTAAFAENIKDITLNGVGKVCYDDSIEKQLLSIDFVAPFTLDSAHFITWNAKPRYSARS